jgi:hypothetical protein
MMVFQPNPFHNQDLTLPSHVLNNNITVSSLTYYFKQQEIISFFWQLSNGPALFYTRRNKQGDKGLKTEEHHGPQR